MQKNEKKLEDLLRNIWDDEEFLKITMRSFVNETERKALINIIEKNKNISVSDISTYSYLMDEKHDKEKNKQN